MSLLQNIQFTVIDVGNAIGTVMDAYVAICDNDGNFVAICDNYINNKGTDAFKPFIKKVIRDGIPTIIDCPGKHPYCEGCSNEENCPEALEMIMPFRYMDEMIGYISIITFSREQALYFKERQADFMTFLEQMGNLIVRAVAEADIRSQLNLVMGELTSTMNAVNNGLITCNNDGLILHCNQLALDMLKTHEERTVGDNISAVLSGCQVVETVLTSHKNVTEREWIPEDEKLKNRFLVSGRVIVDNKGNMTGAVFVIQDIKEAHRFIHQNYNQSIEYNINDIIGESRETEQLKRKIRAIAHSKSTVLIRGETGTGKELVARAIHTLSNRNNGPFVAINCAAIPDTLLESELFGYEEGAFTGARSRGKAGKFEFANGGTVFLDEIGDMPLHLQAKILRVMQDKVIERIGGHASLELDIRIIAATHQNLEEKIASKEFREDLFYRLAVIPIVVVPLRDRKIDIMPLVSYFIKKLSSFVEKPMPTVDESFKTALLQYDWPGNVREIQNAIEYAINIEESGNLTLDSLPLRIQNFMADKDEVGDSTLEKQVVFLEKTMILKALKTYGSDPAGVIQAAEALGISRATLYRKAKRTDIDIPNIR